MAPTVESEAWQHFKKCEDREYATCNYCATKLSIKGSSTTGLWRHLKNKHVEKLAAFDGDLGESGWSMHEVFCLANDKRQRKPISLACKMDIIRRYERGDTLTTISREIGLALSTVNTIVKIKDRICAQWSESGSDEQRTHNLYPSTQEQTVQQQKAKPKPLPTVAPSLVLRVAELETPTAPPEPIAEDDEVVLKWNNYNSNLKSTFASLLERNKFVDVTLCSEGKFIKCHRLILSACSAHFEEILNEVSPSQHPVIILNGTPFAILKGLIDFMYLGELHIEQTKLQELLDIATALKIKGLSGKDRFQSQQPEPIQTKRTTAPAHRIKRKKPNRPEPSPNVVQSEEWDPPTVKDEPHDDVAYEEIEFEYNDLPDDYVESLSEPSPCFATADPNMTEDFRDDSHSTDPPDDDEPGNNNSLQ